MRVITETTTERKERHMHIPTRFAIHYCEKFLQHPLKRISTATGQLKYQQRTIKSNQIDSEEDDKCINRVRNEGK